MDAYLLDWANLLLRWLHVITAVAWIGASLHFVLLDNSLYKPDDPELRAKGVDGEAWAVHGGGFYHSNKYLVAPKNLPDKLHWSYWESYSTWLSGFALLTVLYFFNASSFLVDKRVFDWSPGAAIAGSLAYLVLGWIVHDAICRIFGRNKDGSVGGDLRVGILVFVYTCLATWIACQFFAGRAAFLLTGAMLATVMSANVLMVIIPGQRKVVAALRARPTGRPQPWPARQAAQCAQHLLHAASDHRDAEQPLRHGLPASAQLAGADPADARRRVDPAVLRAEAQGAAALGTGGRCGRAAGAHRGADGARRAVGAAVAAARQPVSFAQVQGIVEQRCTMCHNAQVISKNVQLHTPALIRQHAQAIYQQVVVLKAMPMNNATQITDIERAQIGQWVQGGASLP